MGNNCCINSRDAYHIGNAVAKGLKIENDDFKNVHEFKKLPEGSKNHEFSSLPIKPVNETLTEDKSRETSQSSGVVNQQLLKKIKNITKYKTNTKVMSPHHKRNSTNSKLTYSMFINEKSSSFYNSKNGNIKPFINLQEVNSLKTGKQPNVLLTYISETCWNRIIDRLCLPELREVGITCTLLNKIASTPAIMKKFFSVVQTSGMPFAGEIINYGLKLDIKGIANHNNCDQMLLNEIDLITIANKSNASVNDEGLHQSLEIINSVYESNFTEADESIRVTPGNLSTNHRGCQSYILKINELSSSQVSNYNNRINPHYLQTSNMCSSSHLDPSIKVSNDSADRLSKNREKNFSGSITDVSFELSGRQVASSLRTYKEQMPDSLHYCKLTDCEL